MLIAPLLRLSAKMETGRAEKRARENIEKREKRSDNNCGKPRSVRFESLSEKRERKLSEFVAS